MQVFTSPNLAMFQDIIEEEENLFIEKASKAQAISASIIREFVNRTLQRIVYGIETDVQTDI